MKIKYLLCITVILCLPVLVYAAESEIFKSTFPMKINYSQEAFEKEQYLINDTLYVPCRELCEKLGADVVWDEKKHEVKIDTYNKKVRVSENTEYKEDGVIPDKETAYIVGKAILEKYVGRPVEYETEDKRFYLYVSYIEECNCWSVKQTFEYLDGRIWASGGAKIMVVYINKNTGEVDFISTYSSYEHR